MLNYKKAINLIFALFLLISLSYARICYDENGVEIVCPSQNNLIEENVAYWNPAPSNPYSCEGGSDPVGTVLSEITIPESLDDSASYTTTTIISIVGDENSQNAGQSSFDCTCTVKWNYDAEEEQLIENYKTSTSSHCEASFQVSETNNKKAVIGCSIKKEALEIFLDGDYKFSFNEVTEGESGNKLDLTGSSNGEKTALSSISGCYGECSNENQPYCPSPNSKLFGSYSYKDLRSLSLGKMEVEESSTYGNRIIKAIPKAFSFYKPGYYPLYDASVTFIISYSDPQDGKEKRVVCRSNTDGLGYTTINVSKILEKLSNLYSDSTNTYNLEDYYKQTNAVVCFTKNSNVCAFNQCLKSYLNEDEDGNPYEIPFSSESGYTKNTYVDLLSDPEEGYYSIKDCNELLSSDAIIEPTPYSENYCSNAYVEYNLEGQDEVVKEEPTIISISRFSIFTPISAKKVEDNAYTFELCVPVVLLFGLLFASMYATGNNPFFFFDISRVGSARALKVNYGRSSIGSFTYTDTRASDLRRAITKGASGFFSETATGSKLERKIDEKLDKVKEKLKLKGTEKKKVEKGEKGVREGKVNFINKAAKSTVGFLRNLANRVIDKTASTAALSIISQGALSVSGGKGLRGISMKTVSGDLKSNVLNKRELVKVTLFEGLSISLGFLAYKLGKLIEKMRNSNNALVKALYKLFDLLYRDNELGRAENLESLTIGSGGSSGKGDITDKALKAKENIFRRINSFLNFSFLLLMNALYNKYGSSLFRKSQSRYGISGADILDIRRELFKMGKKNFEKIIEGALDHVLETAPNYLTHLANRNDLKAVVALESLKGNKDVLNIIGVLSLAAVVSPSLLERKIEELKLRKRLGDPNAGEALHLLFQLSMKNDTDDTREIVKSLPIALAGMRRVIGGIARKLYLADGKNVLEAYNTLIKIISVNKIFSVKYERGNIEIITSKDGKSKITISSDNPLYNLFLPNIKPQQIIGEEQSVQINKDSFIYKLIEVKKNMGRIGEMSLKEINDGDLGKLGISMNSESALMFHILSLNDSRDFFAFSLLREQFSAYAEKIKEGKFNVNEEVIKAYLRRKVVDSTTIEIAGSKMTLEEFREKLSRGTLFTTKGAIANIVEAVGRSYGIQGAHLEDLTFSQVVGLLPILTDLYNGDRNETNINSVRSNLIKKIKKYLDANNFSGDVNKRAEEIADFLLGKRMEGDKAVYNLDLGRSLLNLYVSLNLSQQRKESYYKTPLEFFASSQDLPQQEKNLLSAYSKALTYNPPISQLSHNPLQVEMTSITLLGLANQFENDGRTNEAEALRKLANIIYILPKNPAIVQNLNENSALFNIINKFTGINLSYFSVNGSLRLLLSGPQQIASDILDEDTINLINNAYDEISNYVEQPVDEKFIDLQTISSYAYNISNPIRNNPILYLDDYEREVQQISFEEGQTQEGISELSEAINELIGILDKAKNIEGVDVNDLIQELKQYSASLSNDNLSTDKLESLRGGLLSTVKEIREKFKGVEVNDSHYGDITNLLISLNRQDSSFHDQFINSENKEYREIGELLRLYEEAKNKGESEQIERIKKQIESKIMFLWKSGDLEFFKNLNYMSYNLAEDYNNYISLFKNVSSIFFSFSPIYTLPDSHLFQISLQGSSKAFQYYMDLFQRSSSSTNTTSTGQTDSITINPDRSKKLFDLALFTKAYTTLNEADYYTKGGHVYQFNENEFEILRQVVNKNYQDVKRELINVSRELKNDPNNEELKEKMEILKQKQKTFEEILSYEKPSSEFTELVLKNREAFLPQEYSKEQQLTLTAGQNAYKFEDPSFYLQQIVPSTFSQYKWFKHVQSLAEGKMSYEEFARKTKIYEMDSDELGRVSLALSLYSAPYSTQPFYELSENQEAYLNLNKALENTIILQRNRELEKSLGLSEDPYYQKAKKDFANKMYSYSQGSYNTSMPKFLQNIKEVFTKSPRNYRRAAEMQFFNLYITYGNNVDNMLKHIIDTSTGNDANIYSQNTLYHSLYSTLLSPYDYSTSDDYYATSPVKLEQQETEEKQTDKSQRVMSNLKSQPQPQPPKYYEVKKNQGTWHLAQELIEDRKAEIAESLGMSVEEFNQKLKDKKFKNSLTWYVMDTLDKNLEENTNEFSVIDGGRKKSLTQDYFYSAHEEQEKGRIRRRWKNPAKIEISDKVVEQVKQRISQTKWANKK